MVEFFSGKSRIARWAKLVGLNSRAFDIDFDSSPASRRKRSKHNGRTKRSFMDFNGEAGFVRPIQIWLVTCLAPPPPHLEHPQAELPLRLAVMMVLAGKFGEALYTFGTVCSSWTAINQATSQRDALVPMGAPWLTSVRSGNKMTSRTGVRAVKYQNGKCFQIVGSLVSVENCLSPVGLGY